MRKLMVAVCFALLAGGTTFAQERGKAPHGNWNPEKAAQRMAGKLMLDDEATAKFVPLYQEYMQKLAECRMGQKDVKAGAAQTDQEIDEQLQARFAAQEKRLEVQKAYYDKFKKVLTMKQVQQLYDRPDVARKFPPRGQGRPQMPRR